jgi:error-prone DNA polymerase
MGFYAPAQIVRDARAHGVEVRPLCINASRWDCTLEPAAGRYLAVRLGLRMARGLSNLHGAAIVSARGEVDFASVEEVWCRSGVPRFAIERLADADAFQALRHDRRQALWRVRGLGDTPLPLFAAVDARAAADRLEGMEEMVTLKPLTEGREVVEDYRTVELSLRAHPLSFLREDLHRRGILSCADLERVKDGRHVEVAGIILVRQKPGSAKGVLFITIEDESGVANGILWPDRFEAMRRTILSAAMVGLRGRLQREGLVTHIIVDRVIDYTDMLRGIGDMSFPHRTTSADGAKGGGGPDPREPKWPRPHEGYYPPFDGGADPEDVIRIRSHDFH